MRIRDPAVVMIDQEIRTLLDAPPSGDEAPTLDDIEHTLTAGYARALALEAERLRLERRLTEVASNLHEESVGRRHSEVATLGEQIAAAEGDLTVLRELLSSLRVRADQVRARD